MSAHFLVIKKGLLSPNVIYVCNLFDGRRHDDKNRVSFPVRLNCGEGVGNDLKHILNSNHDFRASATRFIRNSCEVLDDFAVNHLKTWLWLNKVQC